MMHAIGKEASASFFYTGRMLNSKEHTIAETSPKAHPEGTLSHASAKCASPQNAGVPVATSNETRHRRLLPDPRISIIATFAYCIAVFLVDTWVGMATFALVIAAVLIVMRVRVGQILKSIIPLLFILAFTIIAHIPQGIDEGFFYAARILLLALATLAVAFSYDDSQFVRAFSSFGRPLRALHVPVDDIATMFSIALRFIPAGMEEFKRVASAQRSRGAQLDEGGVIARVRLWGNVLVPMLVGLFRRASVLAQAMEARCYGSAARRTSLHGNERLGARGIVVMVFIAVILLALGIYL